MREVMLSLVINAFGEIALINTNKSEVEALG